MTLASVRDSIDDLVSRLPFDIDNIIAIRTPRIRDKESIRIRMSTFKEALLKNSNIIKASVVTEIPGKQIYWDAGGIMPAGTEDSKNYQIVGIDYDFVDVFDVELLAGRNFSKDFLTDEKQALIFNETAIKDRC